MKPDDAIDSLPDTDTDWDDVTPVPDGEGAEIDDDDFAITVRRLELPVRPRGVLAE